jgi:hypothetical protein
VLNGRHFGAVSKLLKFFFEGNLMMNVGLYHVLEVLLLWLENFFGNECEARPSVLFKVFSTLFQV